MTDEIDDPIVQLRDEMSQQFNELKCSFEASIKEKDELIAQLKEQNVGLQRALVRSAVMDPPKEEPPKTEDDIYKETLNKRIERTKFYMQNNI